MIFNFPPNAGSHRDRRVPVGVRVAVQHAARDAARGRYTVDVRPPSVDAFARTASSTATRRDPRRRWPTCTRALAATTTCVAQKHLKRDRGAVGPGARQSAERRPQHLRATARSFGNVFVGIQPVVRLRRRSDAPAVREGLRADARVLGPSTAGCARTSRAHAVLHFGTHGALEFMPGKQSGMSGRDAGPDRLIGDLPNLYLYAVEHPVGRHDRQAPFAAATLISYLTPPVTAAGRLYQGTGRPEGVARAASSAVSSRARSNRNAFGAGRDDPGAGRGARPRRVAEPAVGRVEPIAQIARLGGQAVLEVEYTLIPYGLHVVGHAPAQRRRARRPAARRCADAIARACKPERAFDRSAWSGASRTGISRSPTDRPSPTAPHRAGAASTSNSPRPTR